jgi:hypothetical protein
MHDFPSSSLPISLCYCNLSCDLVTRLKPLIRGRYNNVYMYASYYTAHKIIIINNINQLIQIATHFLTILIEI